MTVTNVFITFILLEKYQECCCFLSPFKATLFFCGKYKQQVNLLRNIVSPSEQIFIYPN